MKKKLLFSIIGILLISGIAALVYLGISGADSVNPIVVKKNAEKNIIVDQIKNNQTDKNKPVQIEASYADGVSSLAELKANSTAVVKARVVRQEHLSAFTTLSHLEVIDTFIGDVAKEIVLYQMGLSEEDGVLGEGEYILFMGKQESDLYKENAYYIVSGTAGIFKIDNQDIVYQKSTLKKEFDESNLKKLSAFIEWVSK